MSRAERRRETRERAKNPSQFGRRELFVRTLKYGGPALLVGTAAGGAVGYEAGYGEGYSAGYDAEQKDSLEITNEPYNLQIQRFEYRFRDADLLARKDVRDQFALLLALWYGQDKTHAIFTQRDVPRAAGKRIYDSIEWIESKDDERLKGNETALGWVSRDEDKIRINLTDESFRKGYTTSSGAPLSPLTTLRDVLTHEMTHLVARRREKAEIISFYKEPSPPQPQIVDAFVRGFRIYFRTDPRVDYSVTYHDLDEAATEIISKSWQETSGMGPGLPTYSETAIPGIEKFIRNLRGILDAVDFSIEDFSFFHAWSDFDGFARKFTENVRVLETDREKINYLVTVIRSIGSSKYSINWEG